nr:hypothetical protein [Tanacetum cinerariifolium]
MMVQAQERMGEGSTNPTDPHHTSTIIQPSISQPQKINSIGNLEEMSLRVLDLETTKTTQALEIDSLKRRVKKLKRRKRSRTHGLKRLYKVGLSARVESPKDEGLGEEDASKQGRIVDIDANKDITLVSTHDEQMFDVDQDLCAERLQAKEQQELNDEEKTNLFMQLLEKRRKFFKAKRAEEKRNKPPAQAQQRKIMCTYLMNMEGNNLTDLKNKSFDFIQKMFNRAFKRVDTFVDFKTKLVEESSKKDEAEVIDGSSKRAGIELEQESSKKQKIVDDKDTTAKTGKKSYYKIIKADGSSKIYLNFSRMLKDFDREDVETLWKLVKAKYGSTRLEGDYERVLWGDLKFMFEPYIKDEVWKMQQRYNAARWMLFNSCRVHFSSLQSGHIYMLVEKRYPLTHVTITYMLNKKLHADYFDEMAYQLLKLVLKQLKNK